MNDKWQQAAEAELEESEIDNGPTAAVTRVTDDLPDTCPEDGCDKETRKRHFPKPHGVPEPAAHTREADCPTHGKVAGIR